MNRVQLDIQSIIRKRELFEPLVGKTVMVTGAIRLMGSILILRYRTGTGNGQLRGRRTFQVISEFD